MSMTVRTGVRWAVLSGSVILCSQLFVGCNKKGTDSADVKASKPQTQPAKVVEPGEALPNIAPKGDLADIPPATAAGDDWPWWRGPTRNNFAAADQKPPIEWGETKNVLWRVKVPGRGHATPCIRGERIFLATGDPEQRIIWMLCFARETGKELWRTVVLRGKFPKIHKDNSHASATAACDGERVYFPYQTDEAVWLIAMDLDGKVLWNKRVGPYKSIQGYSASPALYKSVVIVPTDGSKPNKLTALHRETGEVVWRMPRPDVTEGYASPLIAHVAGRDQLFLVGPEKTRGYDPNNGKLLWECAGPAKWNAATVAFGKDRIYATGGYPEKALQCIRADGRGDVTDTHLAWKSDQKAGYVPSPLLHAGLVYAVSDQKGLMRCYDAASGDVAWEKDLGAPFYSSPVLVGERIYLFDKKGKGYVMKAGRQFEMLATNTLPDGAFATPVIARGRIFLRTHGDFYCLGQK